MSNPAPKLKAALARVEAPWDAARTERTLSGLSGRARTKRRRTRLLQASGATALVLGLSLWLVRAPSRPLAAPAAVATAAPVSPPASAAASVQQLRLPDGTKLRLLDANSDVVVEESEPERIALRVRTGRARFEVEAEDERVFEVRTAQVVFEVLGSVFEVAASVERTWLRVETGQVVALAAQRRRVLGAGEEASFGAALSAAQPAARGVEARASAPEPSSDAHGSAREPDSGGAPERKLSARARRPSVASVPDSEGGHAGADEGWRERAERGDFKEAFPLLPRPDAIEAMDVSELLLAADAARLSGHPRAALPFLTRVVERHADDARAPLAAFTLGGVLMNQLGMPREAEAAYAHARAASLGSALAQDALARQVEAAHRAGDEALARQLAREYLEHYPQGRRVRAVRRFGGL